MTKQLKVLNSIYASTITVSADDWKAIKTLASVDVGSVELQVGKATRDGDDVFIPVTDKNGGTRIYDAKASVIFKNI